MDIYKILKRATPKQLKEIREFIDSLDSKSWERPFTRADKAVEQLPPRDIRHQTGDLGAKDNYLQDNTRPINSLEALNSTLCYNDLRTDAKKIIFSKRARNEAEIFAKFCGLKFAYELKKLKGIDSPSSNFPFF
jgi:hypothetical protein